MVEEPLTTVYPTQEVSVAIYPALRCRYQYRGSMVAFTRLQSHYSKYQVDCFEARNAWKCGRAF